MFHLDQPAFGYPGTPGRLRHITALLLLTATMPLQADVLELRDGTVLDGKYMGGTQSSMRFQAGGELRVIPLADILALTVTGREAAASNPPAQPAQPAAATASTANPATVAAGTRLRVKMTQQVDTRSTKAGSRFSATLEGNLVVDGQTAIPAGAKVYGQVVTAERGGIGARAPVLELKLTEITIGGEPRPLSTEILSGTGEGGGAGRKILKGAAIGGLADGSDGAETGARVGLGVAILAGGKHAGIKKGSLLDFELSAPLQISR